MGIFLQFCPIANILHFEQLVSSQTRRHASTLKTLSEKKYKESKINWPTDFYIRYLENRGSLFDVENIGNAYLVRATEARFVLRNQRKGEEGLVGQHEQSRQYKVSPFTPSHDSRRTSFVRQRILEHLESTTKLLYKKEVRHRRYTCSVADGLSNLPPPSSSRLSVAFLIRIESREQHTVLLSVIFKTTAPSDSLSFIVKRVCNTRKNGVSQGKPLLCKLITYIGWIVQVKFFGSLGKIIP